MAKDDEVRLPDAGDMIQQSYVYRWNRQGRKDQVCVVTARGTMNSCCVLFDDGYAMVTSRNALRKAKPDEWTRSPSPYCLPPQRSWASA